jgi:serine/threonine-protein phosphatase 5
MYGFKNEVIDKYGKDEKMYDCFTEFFKSLPLGHILNKEVLVVHGGLFSKDGVKIEDVKKIDRFKEIPESGLMSELLWSDPCKEKGRMPSKRGVGMSFGPDVAERFLKENNLKLLVRSHEVKMEGYEVEPGNQVITIFSAPNYCDQMGNKGAIIRFKGGEMVPKYIQFSAVPHPNIPIRKYMMPFMF